MLKQEIKELIKRYENEMFKLDTIKRDYQNLRNDQATSYYMGRWCAIGSVICDLKALLSLGGK